MGETAKTPIPFRVERADVGDRVMLVVLDDAQRFVLRGDGTTVDEAYARLLARAMATLGAVQAYAQDATVGRLIVRDLPDVRIERLAASRIDDAGGRHQTGRTA